jgi:hypothetical protein
MKRFVFSAMLCFTSYLANAQLIGIGSQIRMKQDQEVWDALESKPKPSPSPRNENKPVVEPKHEHRDRGDRGPASEPKEPREPKMEPKEKPNREPRAFYR